MGRRVNVIGVGMTKFAKPGQSEDYHVMASKAARAALADAKAATTLVLDDGDLAALCKDPGGARDLYQHGKLRVDGDVRIAHKLGFLKDLI